MSEAPRARAGGTYALGDRTVARIGYGAMQLGALPGRAEPSEEAAVAVLRRAVELGVNHIDTAQFYGDGRANALIRLALHPYPDELALASKVGAVSAGRGLRPAQRPEELRAQVEANLASLGTERLDLVNLRRLDLGRMRAEGEQIVDLDSQLAELADLRSEGKIGAIGLSTVSAEQLRQGLPVGIACVQNAYSVIGRSDEDLLEICREYEIAWVPYFPLGSAFSGLPKVTDAAAVVTIAETLDVAPAQVGLAWLLAHGANILLIPGTSQVVHLEQNVGAADVRLDGRAMATLDALASA